MSGLVSVWKKSYVLARHEDPDVIDACLVGIEIFPVFLAVRHHLRTGRVGNTVTHHNGRIHRLHVERMNRIYPTPEAFGSSSIVCLPFKSVELALDTFAEEGMVEVACPEDLHGLGCDSRSEIDLPDIVVERLQVLSEFIGRSGIITAAFLALCRVGIQRVFLDAFDAHDFDHLLEASLLGMVCQVNHMRTVDETSADEPRCSPHHFLIPSNLQNIGYVVLEIVGYKYVGYPNFGVVVPKQNLGQLFLRRARFINQKGRFRLLMPLPYPALTVDVGAHEPPLIISLDIISQDWI